MSDQKPRDEIRLGGVGRPDRQPEAEHRERTASHEQHCRDNEKDERRPVPVTSAQAEPVDHGSGDTGHGLIVQKSDERVNEDERKDVEARDQSAVDRHDLQSPALGGPNERPRATNAVDRLRAPVRSRHDRVMEFIDALPGRSLRPASGVCRVRCAFTLLRAVVLTVSVGVRVAVRSPLPGDRPGHDVAELPDRRGREQPADLAQHRAAQRLHPSHHDHAVGVARERERVADPQHRRRIDEHRVVRVAEAREDRPHLLGADELPRIGRDRARTRARSRRPGSASDASFDRCRSRPGRPRLGVPAEAQVDGLQRLLEIDPIRGRHRRFPARRRAGRSGRGTGGVGRDRRARPPTRPRLGDGEVGGGRRLALLLDGARDQDRSHVAAGDAHEVEVRPQEPERLGGVVLRLGNHDELVALSQLLRRRRQTGEQRQPTELLAELTRRPDARVERLEPQRQADAEHQAEQ